MIELKNQDLVDEISMNEIQSDIDHELRQIRGALRAFESISRDTSRMLSEKPIEELNDKYKELFELVLREKQHKRIAANQGKQM